VNAANQTALFGNQEHPVLRELRQVNLEELSPLEALNTLARLLELVKE
jgi:hypothetical protein